MIEFQQLTRTYGDFTAVKPLSLTVQSGEVFGFLGPNGAGKTTTIRMMMGILVPSGGRALVSGLDCHGQRAEVQRHVGYLPDNPIYYDVLRGREILQFVAEMHGMARAEASARAIHMLTEFGLEEVIDEFAVNYSMGMKKKLGLACALIHDPEVLILDEPINGLDPRAARDVQDRLKRAAAAGKTIFMSTHLLDMAEKVCSRVGIIHRGELVATGTLAELRERVDENASLEEVFLKVTDEDAALAPAP
jgi:ABC-2 type transport system ATP-binding protein